MPYVTVHQSPIYHQVSFEDLLMGKVANAGLVRTNETNTRTYYTEKDGSDLFWVDKQASIIAAFQRFNEKYADLFEVDRHSLYREFFIPKKSGGLRKICAPEPPLMDALNELRRILEDKCGALYHTSAFAYIKGRCTVDAVKKHQQNNSHWFLKVDFHDFFGSTTKEFTMATLRNIVPFNLLLSGPRSVRDDIEKAFDLCFLDGGLPQGTPISPMLTNLLMIPIDFALSNGFRDFKGTGKYLVYTRYADDMLISSLQDFDPKEVQDYIRVVLESVNAPYTFKEEKTRYGSRAGSNWNLGLMLNKDNEITVGHRAKKSFRAMITNYILDSKKNVTWSVEDLHSMQGIISYYKMIEPDYFAGLLASMNEKHGVDVEKMIKRDLSGVGHESSPF